LSWSPPGELEQPLLIETDKLDSFVPTGFAAEGNRSRGRIDERAKVGRARLRAVPLTTKLVIRATPASDGVCLPSQRTGATFRRATLDGVPCPEKLHAPLISGEHR